MIQRVSKTVFSYLDLLNEYNEYKSLTLSADLEIFIYVSAVVDIFNVDDFNCFMD